MAKNFHIIIKVNSSKLFDSSCQIHLVLRDGNKREDLNTTLIFNVPDHNIFHLTHPSASVNHIDSIDFYLLSGNESDTILLDSIEVIDIDTKQYTYFPCKRWITKSTLQHEVIPLTVSDKVQKKNCFEIIKGKNKQYYFRLRAGNREIILQSEGYKRKASAMKGIRAIMKVVPYAVIYDLSLRRMKS